MISKAKRLVDDSQRAVPDNAIAALIANTKRARRKLSILQVAEWIEVAQDHLGSIEAVSQRIGISAEMLREFMSVGKLCPSVKKLVANREVDSLDVVYRLSMLRPSEQVAVAREVVAGAVTSNDVRFVASLRKRAPELDIQEVLDRVKKSRNVKQYITQFVIPSGTKLADLRERFAQLLGDENIVGLEAGCGTGTLVLSAEGMGRLREAARSKGRTKRVLVDYVVKGTR